MCWCKGAQKAAYGKYDRGPPAGVHNLNTAQLSAVTGRPWVTHGHASAALSLSDTEQALIGKGTKAQAGNAVAASCRCALDAEWRVTVLLLQNSATVLLAVVVFEPEAMFSLVHGSGWAGWGRHPWHRSFNKQRAQGLRRHAAGDALSGNNGSYFDRVKVRATAGAAGPFCCCLDGPALQCSQHALYTFLQGFQGPFKAGLTSGSLSAMGDLLAQFLTGHAAKVTSIAWPLCSQQALFRLCVALCEGSCNGHTTCSSSCRQQADFGLHM